MPDFRGARKDQPLEARIARLEDIESIRQLKHQYAVYCDNGYNADGMASLFAEDAVWESNKFGSYHGREAFRQFMAGASDALPFALHYMCNAIIDVAEDGLTARGTWILYEPATMSRAGTSERDSVVITADYDDRFIKQSGEWLFSHVRVNFRTVANLHEGWHARPYRDE